MSKEESQEETELKKDLATLADHFYREDTATRERQIRNWRRLKLYWNNFSMVYWSESAKDYRMYPYNSSAYDATDQAYYDKPVNIFRAFLETIIAALSINVPAIACVPDDANDPNDIATARAGTQIAALIYNHNDMVFLWLQALYVYCTEGLIAAYTYPKKDEKYGTYRKPKHENFKEMGYKCPECEARLEDTMFSDLELSEFQPDDDDAELQSEIINVGPVCPACGILLDPELEKQELIVSRIVGYTDEPKTRVCTEVWGGLYVKVANYARTQADTPYLRLAYETHYVNALECHPNYWDKIPHGGWTNTAPNDPYEQYGRLNPQYRGEFPMETVTMSYTWLRPAAFNILEEEKAKKYKKEFPNGCKITMINDFVADYENESLDDRWTLTQNPLSDYLNHDPLGELLTNIQDIVNDLLSLTIQTIEHGIPQTWVDPAVVNINAQKQIDATPGVITATKPVQSGKNIQEAFFQTKITSLGTDIFAFYNILQQLAQFVSGALPSLFGGSQDSGSSRTASEYAMSKGMAMQRLQTPWRMLTIWHKKNMGKAIPLYMKLLEEDKQDEKYVVKSKAGSYMNSFIRLAELHGRIGSIELEPSDKLPVSDEQQADMVMQLFKLNNEEIIKALMDPQNLPFIKKVTKMPEFILPGEEDRQKQYQEISILINQAPTVNPETGEPESSVDVDVDVDDHAVEASICRTWLISDAGRIAKEENKEGYQNVLLHMKEHQLVLAQQMQQQRVQALEDNLVTNSNTSKDTPPNTTGKEKPKPSDEKSEKITGESDGRYPVDAE